MTAYATVDEEDYEVVAGYTWRCRRSAGGLFYAWREGGRQMQHLIMGESPAGMVIDHKDGNGLNNRRANLRFATPEQNAQNARKQRRASASRFKGVRKNYNRWQASITAAGREIYLGLFPSEIEAAEAYDEAARRCHGEFACVNFPRGGERGAVSFPEGTLCGSS